MNSAFRKQGPLTREEQQRAALALAELNSSAERCRAPHLTGCSALAASFPGQQVFLHFAPEHSSQAWLVSNFAASDRIQESLTPVEVPVERALAQVSAAAFSPSRHWLSHTTSDRSTLRIGTSLRQPTTPSDSAVLTALGPPLAHWMGSVNALGLCPLSDGCLPACLNAIEQHALVVDPASRRVLFKNRAASEQSQFPSWLKEKTARDLSFEDWRVSVQTEASVTEFQPKGVPLWLLLPHRQQETVREPLPCLPPTLGETARLLSLGASDKDIAHALGVEHSTARTYASRVLRKLKLGGRRELMQRFSAGEFEEALQLAGAAKPVRPRRA